MITIEWWHYVVFLVPVFFLLALDLGVLHREAHVVRFREALLWSFLWFCSAMVFAAALIPAGNYVEGLGRDAAGKFLLGYILELSLSMDNVFVIALIFGYFRVPLAYQHRVLFWGILGAFIMRGVMIGLGAALVNRFSAVLYVFGAFLVFTGIKMLFADDEGVHPEKNPVIRIARRLFPVARDYDGQRFVTYQDGRRMLTPLALVLLMVETTDLVFAVDSIPAIFGVTRDPFIVFTSNVFAILGLRSLYFMLAGAIGYFRYLKVGLSFVLVFIGIKMLVDPHAEDTAPGAGAPGWWFHFEIPTSISLFVVGGIILLSIGVSVFAARRERKPGARSKDFGSDATPPAGPV